MEKLVKIEYKEPLDRKHWLYYVKAFDDGLFLCRSAMGRKKKV